MKMKVILQLFAASTALPLASTFTTPLRHASTIGRITTTTPHSSKSVSNNVAPTTRNANNNFNIAWSQIMMTSSDGEIDDATTKTQPSPSKRRKRKDGKQFSPPTTTSSSSPTAQAETEVATTEPEEEPKEEAPAAPKQNVVVMQVRDIRDVVSGVAPESSIIDVEEDDDEELEDDEQLLADDDELADDEEWEYYDVDADGNEIIASDADQQRAVGMGGRPQDDSLEQLLADARQMRSSSAGDIVEEEETSVKDTIFNIISTIVTVDFFVVLGLLAWFLAGIFCSYVLKDDAVQIAFNMKFESVVQPALGLLMVGSVAGSFGNDDEDEEEY